MRITLQDVNVLDTQLVMTVRAWVMTVVNSASSVALIIVITPVAVFIFVPLAAVYLYILVSSARMHDTDIHVATSVHYHVHASGHL